jgi:DNA-binding transcriptional ArsR family regulator
MNLSTILLNDASIMVSKALVNSIGLNKALVLQQLHNLLNRQDTWLEDDGSEWVRKTYEEWHEYFPFWSTTTIKRIFYDLEKAGLIISAQLDKSYWDRTKYYRIDYQALGDLSRYLLDETRGVKDEP